MIRLITKKDLADKLSMSIEWIEQAIPKGLIPPPIELDGQVRWSDEAIDRWIRAGCPKVKQQEKHIESDMLYDSTKTLEDVKKEALIDALEKTNGNREQAAKLLRIGERTVYRKIQEYGLG